ncbi:MAG: hypothetical protein M3O71_31940 [Bacteroidota bacterium]|nr:hypothetical protein [Bacteroidota bacterium]
MSSLSIDAIEKEIVKVVQEAADHMGVAIDVDAGCAPGSAGISSQVLVTVMCRLEGILDITLPDNCYIFHDRTSLRQLTVRESSEKLFNIINKVKDVR